MMLKIADKAQWRADRRLRKAVSILAACAFMALTLCQTPALAMGRDLPVAAQLGDSVSRASENYTASHWLLGVSARDHAEMIGINADYSGWIQQSDTQIDYPIAQSADNSLYLGKNFKLESSKAGCLFLDYRNGAFFRDANSAIYGHHMKNGSMFASLVGYKDQDYLLQHPDMRMYTPYGDYDVKIFTGIIVSGAKDFLKFNFNTDEEFDAYWQPLLAESATQNDVKIERGDRLISLVTCTYEYDNARYIVCGKLVPVKIEEK